MTTIAARLACLIGLALFSVLASAAPPKHTLPITGSPQKAGSLCWAAVTEMAVNAVANPQPPMTQERQAAFAFAGVEAVPVPLDKAGSFASALTRCTQANIGNCDLRWHPILEGVVQDEPATATPLKRERLMDEIGVAERPVIFSWEYPDENDDDRPTRGHYLIAIGYDSTTTPSGFLTIWDPWPAGEGDQRPIKYNTYAGVTLDMGLRAKHLMSYPGLRGPARPNPPTGLTVDGGAASTPQMDTVADPSAPLRLREVSFSTAARRSLPLRQRDSILRERSQGRSDAAPMTLGVPFPIIALHINDIVANDGRPERLLAKRTSSMLYPVMLRGQVVDSFLMANIDGKWVEAGYANTAITRRLVQWRARNAGPGTAKERDFFLLSVPHYSAFFASYRPGKNAMAIAATTDDTIGTREGETLPAAKVLANIVGAEMKRRAEGR